MKKITIAIDGFSSCGKSTMAKDLAREVGYIYVDTGAMYRCVTLYALHNGLFDKDNNIDIAELEKRMPQIVLSFSLNNTTGMPEACLNGENVELDIRSMEVSKRVSVEQQRRMGKEKGIVMDGRDIGTTVFPDAELKIYVTANARVRAQRRYDELKAKGIEADFESILHNVEERDYIDSHREVSPLTKAADAIELDNSRMTLSEQKQWLLDRFHEATEQ